MQDKINFFAAGFTLFFGLLIYSTALQAQKVISEGTLMYNLSVQTGSKEPKMADMFDGVTTTIYIKNSQSRTEMVSGLGSETTIYDSRTGTGVILKDFSQQKLMITLTKDNWEKINKKYEGITYETTDETTTIAGYNCVKAIAKLADGNSFVVYYSPDLKVANKEFDQFKTLPGLAMQYEMQTGEMKLKYTLATVNFTTVPSSKFDIPKTGYNTLTYEEAQKINRK